MFDLTTLGGALTALVIALAVLVASGRWTIRLLLNIATALGLSEFSVAFIFLAVATSIPELFVSISSAQQGAGDIVLAVALGSNVINMTLIIGLATLISAGISTAGLRLRRDIFMGIGVSVLPILFLLNGVISRFEGFILVALYLFYTILLWRDQSRQQNKALPKHIGRGVQSALVMIVVIGLLIWSADTTVESAVAIAELINIPTFLIGIFLLAIGTSLPELTTTLQSAFQRKPTLALGNILGSNIADSALIVGIASLVKPLTVTIDASLAITSVSVIITLVVIGWFAFSRQKISVAEGLFLLLLFALFSLSIVILTPTVI